MGIQGLLPNVDKVSRIKKIDEFRGKRVAIDTYGWLHRSAANCAEDLVLGRSTRMHIQYCIDRVNLLKSKGIIPVCIFDGAPLPMKRVTEEERHMKRSEAKKELLLLKKSRKCPNSYEIRNLCQRALDITPDIAHQVIEELRGHHGIECIVAPYEADAQLSYLCRTGYVDAIITEDSDMLVFGSPCTIYKHDDKTGICRVIYWEDLPRSGILRQDIFTYEMFVLGCTLTGCDYVKSPQGVGIKTAMKLVQEYYGDLERIILQLQTIGKNVSSDYSINVQKALITFFHQTVYDPPSQRLVPLSRSTLPQYNNSNNIKVSNIPIFREYNPEKQIENNMYEFVGPFLEEKLARNICMGYIHPETLRAYSTNETVSEKVVDEMTSYAMSTEKKENLGGYNNVEGHEDALEQLGNKIQQNEQLYYSEELLEISAKEVNSEANTESKSNCNLKWYNEANMGRKVKRRAIWLNTMARKDLSKCDTISPDDQLIIQSLDNYAFH
ncbi:hypothetical protein cand_006800 [Cryptosporidium andersoni]|uniref:Uncharacterized protein n=1 Tax=Cryptosporidium andersoni TaxID=117008 RepID=A0A1J4MRL8_9CRYT|nr:hypothetical protein cand_006800 [Cryptosporidium andersoni]